MEKNASLLARNKVTTALDALDTLERPIKKRGRAPKKAPILNDDKKEEATPQVDDLDDPIWDELKKLK